MNRSVRVLLASFVVYAGIEAAVFHTDLYPYFLNPDESAGNMETRLDTEIARPKETPYQILGIGDSRMALVPKIADEMNTGYKFGSVGVAGTTPRCWYYMLRRVDPRADKYSAIVVTLESYDDAESAEDLADREMDLHFMIARLGIADISEFSRSFHKPSLQQKVALQLLFKELVYKQDFQDFLHHPLGRIQYTAASRRASAFAFYNFVGDSKNLQGLTVDWDARKVTVPPGTNPDRKDGLERTLVRPLPAQDGRMMAYNKYWLGKIHERYRNSNTKLVFLRLPRGAWIRPDQPPYNPHSSVRELATDPFVALLPEHYFDPLETPELFHDEVHLNQPGVERFTRMLVPKLVEILGPAH